MIPARLAHRARGVVAAPLWGVAALAVLAAAATPAGAGPGRPSDWDVLIPHLAIVDAVAFGDRLAGADDGGGLLLFDPADGSIETIDTIDGLLSLRAQVLATDAAGQLWVGTADAGIARLDPAGSILPITGLQAQLDVRALATDGSFVYYGGPAGAGRLVDALPEQTFTEDNGLVDDDVRAVAVQGARVWFGTAAGVSRFDPAANSLDTVVTGLGDLDVRALVSTPEGLVAGTPTGLYRLDESVPDSAVWVALTPALPIAVDDLAVSPEGALAVFSSPARVVLRDAGGSGWTDIVLPTGEIEARGVVFDAQGRLWVHGSTLTAGRIHGDRKAVFYDPDAGFSPTVRGLFGTLPRGFALDGGGGIWVGAFPVFDGLTHWRADGGVVAYDRRESGAGDGWMVGLKNAIARTRDGDLWVSTFTAGVTRMRPSLDDDPEAATYLHLEPDTSPLRTERVRRIAEDAAGRIWFLSSAEAVVGDLNVGIDILLDPQQPFDPSSWLKLTPSDSRLASGAMWDLDFESDTVVWLAMAGAIQRWDFSAGLQASRNDDLAWRTITRLPESSIGTELTVPRDIERGSDGRFWVATDGDGVFGFEVRSSALVLSSDVTQLRVSNFGISLLSDRARQVAIDARGDVWVATEAGLNRFRDRGGERAIDSWTDFLAFDSFGLADRFLPDVLSPLPGANLTGLTFDAERDEIYALGRGGVSRLRAGAIEAASGGDLEFGVYPNPLHADDDGVYVDDFEGEATVEVYNVLGVLMHTARAVRAGERVWDTRNLLGERVASGLYVVRLTVDGRTALRTLAVER